MKKQYQNINTGEFRDLLNSFSSMFCWAQRFWRVNLALEEWEGSWVNRILSQPRRSPILSTRTILLVLFFYSVLYLFYIWIWFHMRFYLVEISIFLPLKHKERLAVSVPVQGVANSFVKSLKVNTLNFWASYSLSHISVFTVLWKCKKKKILCL